MNEQVCTKAVDTCGYPVETTGNAVLDTLEHRSSTRAFARDDDDRPVAVTDEQRAAILHAASRAPSAGAMMMYSIVSIREQATLDRLADLCDHQMLKDMHMTPVNTIEEALKLAFEMKGADAKVAVIPDGLGVVVAQH